MEEVLEIYYRKNYKALLKRAMVVLNDISIAEDVVQEVFLHFLKHKSKWNEIVDKEGYLFRAVTNRSINVWRKKQKFVDFDVVDSSEMSIVDDHEWDDGDVKILKEKLRRALIAMPKGRALIFKLSRYEGLDTEEISTYLEISKSTVKNQLASALKFLRDALSYSG